MEKNPLTAHDLKHKVSKHTPLEPPCRFTPEELEEEIRLAFQQIEKGEVISHEEVMKRMDEITLLYVK